MDWSAQFRRLSRDPVAIRFLAEWHENVIGGRCRSKCVGRGRPRVTGSFAAPALARVAEASMSAVLAHVGVALAFLRAHKPSRAAGIDQVAPQKGYIRIASPLH